MSGLNRMFVAAAAISAVSLVGANAPAKERADDTAAFKQFGDRVQAYRKLQQTVESGLPVLKPTDLPEMISAYQEALARKIREARPRAKAGDIFTPAACEAFRHASRAALAGPDSAASRAYRQRGEADTRTRLTVNGVYPDAEPITALSPALLSAVLVSVAALVLSAGGGADFAFPLQANSVRLAAIGDVGTGDQPQADVVRQMVKSRAVFPFEFVITLGDNLYSGSQPSDYEKVFAVP
jgi:hypothetical protein